MSTPDVSVDFSKDDLGRQKFADRLVDFTFKLAQSPSPNIGRVIAVDAPWGSGKSWIAKRLPGHFTADKRIEACIYIDAFQHDYHQDPFAVIASAILDSIKENTPKRNAFKKAAADVLRVTLPTIGKGLVKAGGSAVGINTDDLLTTIADVSEKSLDSLLSSFSQTKATAEAFREKLSSLATNGNSHSPLVIVIDELDRCRPSYALELLERVKHLFDVPNVAFIFFLHAPTLHSAIKKTYGSGIDPAEYLRKFFSLTINLPVAEIPAYDISHQSEFFERFINAQFPRASGGISSTEDSFRAAVADFAPLFGASFRDIENVMLLWELIDKRLKEFPVVTAYSLLLRVRDQEQLRKLRFNPQTAFSVEIARLENPEASHSGRIQYMRELFLFGDNLSIIDSSVVPLQLQQQFKQMPLHHYRDELKDFLRVVNRLGLEYVRT